MPVHIVTGAPGSGKSTLVARLTRERTDWLGLVNTLADPARNNLRQLSAGCPCCTGRIVLQVSLVRALRETGATRALVELAGPTHVADFAKLLQSTPFSLSVRLAREVVLPRDAAIAAAELDLQRTLSRPDDTL